MQVATGGEVGVAEVPGLHIVLAEQEPNHIFAVNDVVFPGFQSRVIEREVAETMITKFKSGIDPHGKGFDSLVHLSPVIDLLFIDEANSRYLLVAQTLQQVCVDLGDRCCRHGKCCVGRKIINRDRDLAVGLTAAREFRGQHSNA